jgi:Zn finger protein HypA/HybF involved in hydrogenase expression
MAKKFSTEEFVARAKAVHGDRYDYSKSRYISYHEPIAFLCAEHGLVTQKPSNHLRGIGCIECAHSSKRKKTQLSTDEFISRAKAVHGDRYDYSQTKYVVKRTELTIVCREHGTYTQLPSNHLAGRGCPACHRANSQNHKLSTAEYIARSESVHGATYDYSETEYSHSQKPLRIVCRVHGRFQLNAAMHLQGRGCPSCAKERRRAPKRVSLAEFIRRSSERHNNKYDYGCVSLNSVSDLVTIVCPEHGAFVQKARAHYDGNGCPQCGRTRKNVIAIYREEFIRDAKAVHAEKYDYSRVIFKSKRNGSKVEIVCRNHGAFLQNPMSHLRGSGCPGCAGNASHTASSFVAAARSVHGDKYAYDSAIFISSTFPVRVTCREHGDFSVTPAMHIAGRGCRRCSDERRTELLSMTTEEFISAAKAVHGETFDYSATAYVNNNQKVTIKCRSHGAFHQLPRSHLAGIGCYRCSASKGEARIRAVLHGMKIEFREQVNFPDLVFPETGGRLRFDFYIDGLQTAIEFDGAQHFEPINFSGLAETELEVSFEQLKNRDAFKSRYCAVKDIRLIRIPYTELETISDLLADVLSST